MLKMAVVLCAVISIAITSVQPSCIDSNDVNMEFRDSDVFAAPEVTEKTWYQDGAFLRIINGTFTVELLTNDSAPKSLYAEGLRIVEVKRGFAKISTLESISLEDNLIERIDGLVFEGLPQLVYLNLARNRISYLVEDSFKGLDKLQVLNLNRNALTNTITFSISSRILPALRQLFLQHNMLEYIQETDNQQTILCNSNLRHLYLSNNSLGVFSFNSFREPACLNYLTHLFLDDNHLNEFTIGKMPLEALMLDGNQFYQMPEITQGLKFFSIARNRVQSLSNLKNAENIAHLVLSYNSLQGYYMQQMMFQNLSTLEHLALDHNSLDFIPDGCFYNLSSLRSLYLSDNQIISIFPNAFALLPALREISFNNNGLSSFPGKESFGESNLTYLDLSNNRVENVSDLKVNMIPKLKVLKLAGNPLKRIEPGSVSSDVSILL